MTLTNPASADSVGLVIIPQPLPRWYRPWRLLVLFAYGMLLVWVDQGTLSAATVAVCEEVAFEKTTSKQRASHADREQQ